MLAASGSFLQGLQLEQSNYKNRKEQVEYETEL